MAPQLMGGSAAQSLAVDYILGGHEQLFPTGKRGKADHLDAELRMFQKSLRPGFSELEARILYTPCFIRMELDVRCAVRQLRWSKRKRGELLPLLPSRVETFHVGQRAQKRIDEAAKQMEEAMSRVDLDLNIHAEFGTSKEHAWPARTPGTDRLLRRISANAAPVRLDLQFSNSLVLPAINSAWQDLWDTLGESFHPANRIRATVKYPITLVDFGSALGAKA
jgi:hypothetical protein